jgi:transcriptional regulator of met regulon
MKAKTRLTHLAGRLSESKKSNVGKSTIRELHPAYGEKSDFRKLTVTLSPELFAQVIEESTRRKVAGAENANTSAVIREALVGFFARQADKTRRQMA